MQGGPSYDAGYAPGELFITVLQATIVLPATVIGIELSKLLCRIPAEDSKPGFRLGKTMLVVLKEDLSSFRSHVLVITTPPQSIQSYMHTCMHINVSARWWCSRVNVALKEF